MSGFVLAKEVNGDCAVESSRGSCRCTAREERNCGGGCATESGVHRHFGGEWSKRGEGLVLGFWVMGKMDLCIYTTTRLD